MFSRKKSSQATTVSATATKEPPILKALPLQSIGSDFIQRKDGRFCAVFSVTPINMLLLSDEEVDRAVQAVREAINTAPNRLQILVSSERLNLDEYVQYLRKSAERSTNADHLEQLQAMIEYIQNRTIRSEKVLKFYLVVEAPFDKEAPALAELVTYERILNDIHKAEGMTLNRLQHDDIYELYYQKLNPKTALLEDIPTTSTLQGLCPSAIDTKTNPTYYIMDETYYRSFTLVSFPTKVNQASWLSPILELPIDIDFSMTMAATDKEAMLQALNRSVRNIRNMKSDAQNDVLRQKTLERQEKDAEHLLEEMSTENESLFRTTMVLTLRADSREELKNAEKTLRTRISSRQMQSRPLTSWAFQPLWYTLPMCYKGDMERYVYYDLPALTLGSMQPFNSSTLSGNDGVVLGINEQSHDLIIITEEMRARNPHTVYIADTRAGKSYALYADIFRKLAQGRVVIDIDPERERGSIPGNHIIFSPSSNITLNPFHIRSAVVDTDSSTGTEGSKAGDYLRLKIERTKPFFQWIYPELNAVQLAILDKAMIEAYKRHGLTFDSETLPEEYPTLTELVNILSTEYTEATEDFCLALSPYYGEGTYGRLFDGQTNWGFTYHVDVRGLDGETKARLMTHQYTRLDIHELYDGPALAPMMDLLLKDVWEFVKQDRSQQIDLDIDEMWIISDPERPQTLKFIFEMSKRGGKYGVRMTTATQNVSDFLRAAPGVLNPPGEAIISNSGVKVLLRLSKKDIARITEFVELSAKEQLKLERAEQGHGIVIVGNQHAELHTFMTDAELKYYNPERYAAIHGKARW